MLVNTTLQIKLEDEIKSIKKSMVLCVNPEFKDIINKGITKLETIANSNCYYRVSEYTKTVEYIKSYMSFFGMQHNIITNE